MKTFEELRPSFEEKGLHLHGVSEWLNPIARKNFNLAMDAQPSLFTTPNSGVPSLFTTAVDPETVRILFSPTEAANILPESQLGDWADQTELFMEIENAGEVSNYGDFNANGHATANVNWPQRQNMLFQIFVEYGDLEMDRAAKARLNWKTELENSAADLMNRYQNTLYFFGFSGLQNYGLINAPNLPAAIQPGPKAYQTQASGPWVTGTSVTASPTEIFLDIQSLVMKVVTQGNGTIKMSDPMDLMMSPQRQVALTTPNSFGVTAESLLKINFPNITVKTAVQYGAYSALNFQGSALGEMMQLIVQSVGGITSGKLAYSVKLKTFPPVRSDSSVRQKWAGGSWGAIIRRPTGFASMVGI